jgi:RNA polymerase sigma factor (sigma-70 family)
MDSLPATSEAAAVVFERLRPSLLRFFERRVACVDVEDLVQEVFIRLARQARGAAIREPERYVFRVATNVLRDRLRRQAVRCGADHVPLDDPESIGEAPSEERIHESRELLARVLAALEQLPPKCRATFLLHRFEGLSYSEIARRLGVSRSAIEKQMMHVIQVLSDRFPNRP